MDQTRISVTTFPRVRRASSRLLGHVHEYASPVHTFVTAGNVPGDVGLIAPRPQRFRFQEAGFLVSSPSGCSNPFESVERTSSEISKLPQETSVPVSRPGKPSLYWTNLPALGQTPAARERLIATDKAMGTTPVSPAAAASRSCARGKFMGTALLTWAVLLLGQTKEDSLAPWASNHHPTDVAKRHVQEIDAGRVEYVVVQTGTMDGRNCRSPQGVWQPFEQTWESNRSVRIENVGEPMSRIPGSRMAATTSAASKRSWPAPSDRG